MKRLTETVVPLVGSLGLLTGGLIGAGLFGAGPLGCSGAPPWPAEVVASLEQAGENRAALEEVLQHYRGGEDSLAYAAALYLIRNMGDHCYVRYLLRDTTAAEIPFEVLEYPDYQALLAAFDSLEASHGTLDFKRLERRNDLEELDAGLLRENIDLALRAWRTKPWARHVSFDDFCDYVLPQRATNEPLESWRPFFLERFAELAAELPDSTDPIAAAARINRDLAEWFKFDPRYYFHPTDQGLAEMRATRLGRCEDMTTLAIYALRANGIAATSDYVPFWANTGNNHAWNSVLDRTGRPVMFMGAEAHPGEYRLANVVGKAYRKTYAEQPENLVFRKEAAEEVPRWLRGKHYRDVTADYTETADVVVTLSGPVPDTLHYAYLCVFNSGEWQAIHWGPIGERGTVTFTAMGTGVVYLPVLYHAEEILPVGDPVLLDPNGVLHPLVVDTTRTQTLHLTRTTQRAQSESSESIGRTNLTAGEIYECFYWRDGWVSLGEQTAGEQPLVFPAAPRETLYWLVAAESRKEERIFTYENDRQIWW